MMMMDFDMLWYDNDRDVHPYDFEIEDGYPAWTVKATNKETA
jgi:hypothetical protein